tara:strand:- start:15 stop:650 length:636 start_codon:yes stop_codon:yes gene_type:complete
MAFFLTKSCFVHTPKCAGRWIKKYLQQSVTITDREYKGTLGEKNHEHYAPTWEELADKKPFAFVRHPITWLASLHNHRMRKKSSYATNGHWFGEKFPLEKIGDNDWNKFVSNVCEYPNWIQEYFDMYVGPYSDKILIGKMETVEQDLLRILDEVGEPHDKNKILGKGVEPHRARPLGTQIRLRQLSKKEINSLYDTQKITFEKYGYTKDFS